MCYVSLFFLIFALNSIYMRCNRQKLKTTLLFLLGISGVQPINGQWLFKDGQSDYSIVLKGNASKSERTAANELRDMIRRISGTTLKVSENPVANTIYIGWTPKTGSECPKPYDEGYTYKTIGHDLYIYGGSQRGTMYGVYAFLERELGVRWYTADFTKVPQMKQYALPQLNHCEKPAIKQRLDFYYEALRHYDWAAHNLINTQYQQVNTPYGDMAAFWGIHTFKVLIPPSTYFKNHPEYFSIYKGKRSDKAQLCLSNTEVRRELIKNLKTIMAEKPGYWCYDVSQNDNPWPCECTACNRLAKKYGGQSGAMIWFVNQVAKEIKQDYPDKYIGTFAYQYTRQAPTNDRIRPADNVVIRLCDIECCQAHSLELCSLNSSFLEDVDNWGKITKNIYIWDYTTGFRNYLLPFPNFDVLAANFRYFNRSNVIGIMEEGAHDAPWAEFSELKQWLIAKLLWNPNQNVDSLATMFINDYYGKAAPYIKQYYDLCKRQINANTHFTIKIDWNANLYSDKFISDADSILKRALTAVAENSNEYRRTQRIAAQLYYLKLRRNAPKSAQDGTINKLKKIVGKDKTVMAELGYTLEQLLEDMKYR